MKFAEWKTRKEQYEKEYDKRHRVEIMEHIRQNLAKEQKQLFDNLYPTLSDARKMYAFLDEYIVKNLRDVTIMCDFQDLRLILDASSKPTV